MVAHSHKPIRRAVSSNLPSTTLTLALTFIAATAASAAPGEVLYEQKISSLHGNFTGALDSSDQFGYSVCAMGDLDGDGTSDVAVGTPYDDDGGTDRGAVWILFLQPDGSVKAQQKISATAGNFGGALDDNDLFGSAIAPIGDRNGDGVNDLAVGAMNDDDGVTDFGAIWVLYLNANGTVSSYHKISATSGGFNAALGFFDNIGNSLASIGDLDGDGSNELAAGAWNDDDGGTNRGAVWILFLNPDGTLKSHQKISDLEGDFVPSLVNFDNFGTSVAGIGDLDLDGVPDIAVGAIGDDDGGALRGAVWVLFLDADGTVKAHQKISNTQGGFAGPLENTDWFGCSVAAISDLDNDGISDLVVGACGDDDGASGSGAAYLIFMNGDGTVHNFSKISGTFGGLVGPLQTGDRFGSGVSLLGDLNGDGTMELAVGASLDDSGGPGRGAVWVLSLEGVVVNQDSDGDGLLDSDETDIYGTDPSIADTDGDGLTDGEEVLVYGTNPLLEDCDEGGIADGWEVLVDGTDPLNPLDDIVDSDGDGLLDGVEITLAAGGDCPDPLVFDSDGDGLSDGEEYLTWQTSLCDPDTDGDGVDDGIDPTPLVPGVPPEFIEKLLDDAANTVLAFPVNIVDAKNAKAAQGRLGAMSNKLEAAALLVAAGQYDAAREELESLLKKLDGAPNPPDWILSSDEKQTLASEIELAIALLKLPRFVASIDYASAWKEGDRFDGNRNSAVQKKPKKKSNQRR
ncbi:MAG: FG-GAP repeat protein [Candidatus Hydrogenedentes bacterium]|nr:FG-GAP repeat protein [Candidatus Hydrogenedentota bacterium]